MRRTTATGLVALLAACSGHAPRATPPGPGSATATGSAATDVEELEAPVTGDAAPPPPTLRLPTTFAPTGYVARLRLDPAQPRFDGELTIHATLAAPAEVVWLDAKGLTIDGADARWAAGAGRPDATAPLAATVVGDHFLALRAARPLPAGAVALHLTYHGALDDVGADGGWRRQWNGDWYAFTQFEAVSARRVFPCVDEPSSKVPWQLTLDVPAAAVALSNTAGAAAPLEAGWQRVAFAPTRPLPSYLVAFAVGPFELVDAGKTPGGAPIRIAAPRGRAAEARYAADITPKIVRALEAWFGSPYPYDKLDEVVVPENSGGMENAGMITYAETRILIDPKDPSEGRRETFASYAAHEIAHHWFGDSVTAAWWDDLWLNEAFATWMEAKILAELDPAWHAELDPVAGLGRALAADDLGAARMIRQPIHVEDDIEAAFDDITYDKGSAVIRMFEQWLGPDKFQAGVRAYLAAHKDGDATMDDFLEALAQASGKDVAAPFTSFLDQAGAPRVSGRLECSDGAARITLAQERYLPRGATAAGAPVWKIPVCVTHGVGELGATVCTLLDGRAGTGALDLHVCPDWWYPNAGGSGYYRVAMPPDDLRALLGRGWKSLDAGARLALADDVVAMVAHGDVDASVALDLVPKLVASGEADLVAAAAALVEQVELDVPDAQRDAYRAWVRAQLGPLARKLGWTARKGDGAAAERLRVAVVPVVAVQGADATLRAEAVKLAEKWQELPSSLVPGVLAAAVEDPKAFAALLAQAPKVTERRARKDLLGALAGVRDPARLAQVLALAIDPALDWTQATTIPGLVADDPRDRAAAAAFVAAHLDELRARIPADDQHKLIRALALGCDAATRADAAQAMETLRGVPGGAHQLRRSLEQLDVCIAQRDLWGPALARYFAKK